MDERPDEDVDERPDGPPDEGPGEGPEDDPEDDEARDEAPQGLTPRQARRVRIVLSGAVMAAVAVALVVRVRSEPSLVTVGFYGMALLLSGTAIELSRRGRTRVATAVLLLGFASVALGERVLAAAG
ncbi:hypothetical protein HCC30_16980 [Streptomyces sp. HNM0574]|nr:hypothetical protein [Streptomyces sp. HNM0574]